MQINSNVPADLQTIQDKTVTNVNDQGFQQLVSSAQQGNEGDTMSLLLQIITTLLGLLNKDQAGNGQSDAGNDLADSLTDLADAVKALTGSDVGGANGETAVPSNPRDLNGDGAVSVFEVVDYHVSQMAKIQEMAKSPLDYIAGGRDIM